VLIAFEGVDGSGKTTQVALLVERLRAEGHAALGVSFPRYGDAIFGGLIKRFLRGELGEVGSVDPQLVALLFAGDRGAEAPRLRQALCEDQVVVCDRYFYSNLAYQGAKLEPNEVADFARWLRKLEFGHFAVPAPDCSIYLDVHQDERQERLVERVKTNAVSNGAVPDDIHEMDMSLQAKVEQAFRSHAEIEDDLVRIDSHQLGARLTPEEVHERVMRVLTARGLIPAPAATSVRV
jgi:dTMP kinase